MRVGVIGVNHKLADLTLRETLAKVCQERFSHGAYWHDDHALLLLSTCNRTEIYFSSEDLAATHSFLLDLLKPLVVTNFDQKLYSYFGYNCFLHLCRVVAGLDSAIIAETEIQGQVKDAYEKTAYIKRLPKEIHYLFQKSLKVGKLIRTHYTFGRGVPDLEHSILEIGAEHFDLLPTKNTLFIGASAINRKLINHFKNKKINRLTLCNRTDAHGEDTAAYCNIAYLPWSRMERWKEFDLIILGTKSHEYLLNPDNSINEKKLILDLSVPRNANPELRQNPHIHLFDIDQITQLQDKRKEQILDSLIHAEKRISLETGKLMHIFRDKESYNQTPSKLRILTKPNF